MVENHNFSVFVMPDFSLTNSYTADTLFFQNVCLTLEDMNNVNNS